MESILPLDTAISACADGADSTVAQRYVLSSLKCQGGSLQAMYKAVPLMQRFTHIPCNTPSG